MPELYVIRALPNPVGKDRPSTGSIPNEKLNGEWAEFQNQSGADVTLEGVSLTHYTFDENCKNTGEDNLITFSRTLGSNKSIRMHTGKGEAHWEGDVYHMFLGREQYVWNNRCGDYVILRRKVNLVDWANYKPNPPEGRMLVRNTGNQLQ